MLFFIQGEEGDIEKLLKNGANQINLLAAAPGDNLEFGENITSTRESLSNTIGKWIETEEQYIYDQDALKDPIMSMIYPSYINFTLFRYSYFILRPKQDVPIT